MVLSDYYRVLDLSPDSSIDDIKKAYRQKARIYHPDINHSPDAMDKFILATEAYEFLIANFQRITDDEEECRKSEEDWRKYRQDRSRQRARAYARSSYTRFRNTKFYRTTRIFNGTTIIFGLAISVLVIVYTIYGYFYRLRNPLPDIGKPTILAFLMLLLLGMVFFALSLIYLKVYLETSKKRKKKSK